MAPKSQLHNLCFTRRRVWRLLGEVIVLQAIMDQTWVEKSSNCYEEVQRNYTSKVILSAILNNSWFSHLSRLSKYVKQHILRASEGRGLVNFHDVWIILQSLEQILNCAYRALRQSVHFSPYAQKTIQKEVAPKLLTIGHMNSDITLLRCCNQYPDV